MKTKQIEVLLKLNEETLQAVTDKKNGACLAFSNKERCKVYKITDAIYVKRHDEFFLYHRSDGSIFHPEIRSKKLMRNFAHIRVLMTFDSIEEFRASDLRTYCVSRLTKKPKQEQRENGGITIGEPRLREHVNTGERTINADELRKVLGAPTKPEEGAFAYYLKQFRDLYKDLANRQKTTFEVAITALVFGGLAFLVSLIALIVATVL